MNKSLLKTAGPQSPRRTSAGLKKGLPEAAVIAIDGQLRKRGRPRLDAAEGSIASTLSREQILDRATLLAKVFMARFAKEMNPSVKGFAADALAAIDGWPWPGNVRELENRVKRAVIMADGKLVSAADLDLMQPGAEQAYVLNLKSAREDSDRRVIRHALARSEGNISSTAKLLGISRPTLYDLLKQYDLHA